MLPSIDVRRLAAGAALAASLFGCADTTPPVAPVAVIAAPPIDAPDASPLARCAAGDLTPATRAAIAGVLESSGDPKVEPCLAKMLDAYDTSLADDSIRYVCRAVIARKPKGVAAPLLRAFKKMHASHENARTSYRDMYDAMIAIADPSWEPDLIALLARPVDTRDMKAATDEMFWQQTAAVILGHTKSERAIRPLFQALLSPAKGSMHVDAVMALLRIGKPAGAFAMSLLARGNGDLAAHADAELRAVGDKGTGAEAVASRAALVLGTLGRADATTAMIDALAAPDAVTRALIARELPKLPKDTRLVDAFRRVYEKMPLDVTVPNSAGSACEVLAEKAADFYDTTLVSFLIDDLKRRKGEDADLTGLREAVFTTTMKLARADQLKMLDALAKQGKPREKLGDAFKKELSATRSALSACGDRVDCWLDRITDPASQKPETQFQAIKAASMIGALGDVAAKGKLLAALPAIKHPAVRFAALMAIDHLSPTGDPAAAATLQTLVEEAVSSKDPARVALNAPMKQVILRLLARVP